MRIAPHPIRILLVLLPLYAALAIAPAATAAEQATLVVETAEGRSHAFSVEVVTTPQEMALGLMYRTQLAADAGMLFVYPAPRETSFWMQNTYLPLDMLFINDDGVIHHIAKRTVPLSTAPVPSNGPVRAVLEINGGASDRLGIAPGDRVSWEMHID